MKGDNILTIEDIKIALKDVENTYECSCEYLRKNDLNGYCLKHGLLFAGSEVRHNMIRLLERFV